MMIITMAEVTVLDHGHMKTNLRPHCRMLALALLLTWHVGDCAQICWHGALAAAVRPEAPDAAIRQQNAGVKPTRRHFFDCTQICRHGALAVAVVPEAPEAAILQQNAGVIRTRRHFFDCTQICRHGALAVGVEAEAPEAAIL